MHQLYFLMLQSYFLSLGGCMLSRGASLLCFAMWSSFVCAAFFLQICNTRMLQTKLDLVAGSAEVPQLHATTQDGQERKARTARCDNELSISCWVRIQMLLLKSSSASYTSESVCLHIDLTCNLRAVTGTAGRCPRAGLPE